ncbi:MAG: dockerin type I domain-containing protein, partial [Euryarchaeota archaeon]|nr:dockerin type I domain-containing protein [Euryarchaeota archaeon]
VVRNPLGLMTILIYNNASATLEFDDRLLYTASPRYYYDTWTPVRYCPDVSNCSIMGHPGSGGGYIRYVTTYNITLRPTSGYLYDVTVDTWDEDSDTYCITASSTVSDNPTWINLTTKATSATYNIKRADADNIKATTDADGVLRYHYDEIWNGPQTFEISYASDGEDPVPRVTNFQNEPPTQQTVTLFWDCSVSDVDYYTIYQNGMIIATTNDQYYTVTNLLPGTTYAFSTSATAARVTGENVTLRVQTVAEDFGRNTVSIADDVTTSRGNPVTVPIAIHDATGVACAGMKLTYDPGVVTVTGVTEGDFISYFGFDDEHAAEGWVMINTYINETQLTGDVKVADVILTAVGEVGATSTLDMEIISIADQNGYAVPNTVSNGLFTVVGDTSPPVVTGPSASQLIPDDTDGVPSWGETTTLSVTVTDESDIASVTIDLSAIGGSPVQPMTCTGDNVWSATTSAPAGTLPQTYKLQVSATDIYGYTNMHDGVELVVMQNGDVTDDDDVSSDDVILLRTYVTYLGRYTISSEFVADVTGDGVVNIADAMLLENHVKRLDQYTLR